MFMYSTRVYSGMSTAIISHLLHRLPAGRIAWQVDVQEVDLRQVEQCGGRAPQEVNNPERLNFLCKYNPYPKYNF